MAVCRSRQHNVVGLDARKLLEDCSRGISQAGALLPHLEALPQDEGEKAHEDMGLSAIFALVRDRTDVELNLFNSDFGAPMM